MTRTRVCNKVPVVACWISSLRGELQLCLTDYPTKPCMISYFHSSRPGAKNNLQPWALKSDVTALYGDYISEDTHVCILSCRERRIHHFCFCSFITRLESGRGIFPSSHLNNFSNKFCLTVCNSTPSWKYLLYSWPIAIAGSWKLTYFVEERKKDSS